MKIRTVIRPAALYPPVLDEPAHDGAPPAERKKSEEPTEPSSECRNESAQPTSGRHR